MTAGVVKVFLSGDVMLGRGVDQVLPHPADPALEEELVRDARDYVRLAQERNGRLPPSPGYAWPWGDTLAGLDAEAPDARVINLETSVTRSSDFAPGKAVCYRMSPGNLPAIHAVQPDVCVLANNHVLDFGRSGLIETLDVLAGAGIATCGAGRDAAEASRPVEVPLGPTSRLVLYAFGSATSGVPVNWAAGENRPGVNHLRSLSRRRAEAIAARIGAGKRPGDIVVVSIHWGSNWGYEVPEEQVRFAHTLIDGGVDLVHGHSSHHPRPIEVYRGRLVLHGCGDLINDYEGIGGFEEYRGDLRLLYLASLDPASGALVELRMVPLRARRLRLEHAPSEGAHWLAKTLDRESRPFGCRVELGPDGALRLRWAPVAAGD